MPINQETGKLGEKIAVRYLKRQGYHILAQNYRYSRAEIDIIAQKNTLIVFVEVKTRSNSYYGAPEEYVSDEQQRLIAEAAEAYMIEQGLENELRFDIIAISISKQKYHLKHIPDAFFFYDDEGL